MLSPNKPCKFSDGTNPRRCFKSDVPCEDECTSLESCIAYGAQSNFGSFCYLFLSSGSCSDGWTNIPGEYAQSANDLTIGKWDGPSCVIKGNAFAACIYPRIDYYAR